MLDDDHEHGRTRCRSPSTPTGCWAGRSGLRVSPLALGTATFGTEWGWGAAQDDARKLFDTYVERGGNSVMRPVISTSTSRSMASALTTRASCSLSNRPGGASGSRAEIE